MKRIVTILCVAALLFSLTACSESNSDAESEADYSNQTLTGQVTAIDGTKVTLLLGEITEREMDMQQMGEGEAPPDAAGRDMSGNGQTPPEIPLSAFCGYPTLVRRKAKPCSARPLVDSAGWKIGKGAPGQ